MFEALWNYFAQNWTHFAQVFAIIFGTGALNYSLTIVYKKLLPKLKKTHKLWDDPLAIALFRPLRLALWFNGLVFAAILSTHFIGIASIFSYVNPYRRIGTVLILVWFFIRFIRELEKRYIARTGDPKDRLDKTTLRAISQILRIAVLGIAGLVIMPTLGISLSGVIAFGGVGGIAIGFAAKDLLANFFGGLMIFLDRPFAIGDWIRSPDRDIEGTVEHIGWRLTRIRTFDKRPLFVPNSLFLSIAIENPERMLNRRIKEKIGIRYSDASKIDTILKQVEEMLRNHSEIDTNRTLFVNLVHFGPHALEIQMYTFTKTTDWVKFQHIQQDIFLKTIAIIEANGAALATTTMRISVKDEPVKEAIDAAQRRLFTK